MKKILGLDLGVSSIGWAIVEVGDDNHQNKILGMGTRIVPLSPDEKDEFEKGNDQTKNRKRTEQRTARKTNFRYKLRREYLTNLLKEKDMLPTSDFYSLNSLQLYGIRAKATSEKVSLIELGRILLHLNQKRGYRGSMKEKVTDEKKQGDYLKAIKEREDKLDGRTIGQFFYEAIQKDSLFEVKKNIFYRATYIHEFDVIWEEQSKHYPNVLTDDFRDKIKNETIYFQRPLKSQKHLVGGCQFESRTFVKNGVKKVEPIKVAPLSSPLFQINKVWQAINNIEIKGIKDKAVLYLEDEQRKMLFDYISNREKTSWEQILSHVGVDKNDYRTNVRKDITGDFTKVAIRKKLEDAKIEKNKIIELLEYNPSFEVKEHDCQAYYKLWHMLYSIEQPETLAEALKKSFKFTNQETEIIMTAQLKEGFSSLSSKALKKILPYLKDGYQYDKACVAVGYNHSSSITKEENELRKLLPIENLQNIQRGKLRNPAVERILNQVINVVKDIYKTYGTPDQIRIELARELKQNADERNKTFKRNNDRERGRKSIIEELQSHPYFNGKRISNRDIEKYKLWMEFDRQSPYRPNEVIGFEELFSTKYEIEHIIPRSLFFDDSFANKCIAHVSDNRDKDNDTAYDFMKTQRASLFDQYCNFIQDYFKRKEGISKTKFERLMTSRSEIPQDFIDRQLRETQYITKEAKKLLSTVCRNVWVTSGSVTDYVRHIWGYDKVIHDLNFDKYKAYGLTEFITIKEDHQDKTIERIKDWSKRLDHRHHAVDALAIACTTQGIIQAINTLSSDKTRNQMLEVLGKEIKNDTGRLLDKYIKKLQPFSTSEVSEKVAGILISFKAGKKVASISKNKDNKGKYRTGKKQWIPRAALHEESVYGKIKQQERIEVKKLTANTLERVVEVDKKEAISQHLEKYGNDFRKAFAAKALKELVCNGRAFEKVTIFVDEYTIKRELNEYLTESQVEKIIDLRIKKAVLQRLSLHENNRKKAFAELDKNPIWIDEKIGLFVKSVTCKTGLSDLWDANRGFVKPGNNHHIAIYENENGELNEVCVTFWEAFERKQQGLEIIDVKHNEFGILKLALQQNEMVIFGLSEDELNEAIRNNKGAIIGKHLYRVQKVNAISPAGIFFRHHLEAKQDEKGNPAFENSKLKEMEKLIVIQSIKKMNCIKVKVDRLGNITLSK